MKYLIVKITERDNRNIEKDKYRKKCNQGSIRLENKEMSIAEK